MEKFDYLIVGSGLFGATFAYRARKAGKRCLVIDRRPHLGGNIYSPTLTLPRREGKSPLQPPPAGETFSLPTGEGRGGAIHVHKYGAHIFHTSNKEVWDFVNAIVPFNRYTNSPIANYKGKLYNLPFNMNTFYQLWGVTTPEEAKAKIAPLNPPRRGTSEPRNLEEQAISLVGEDIYRILIKEYTEKQWGRPCKELPAFIIKRLPLRFTFDNNYFNDKYQGIPIGGYNKLIEGLLAPTAPPQPSPVGREKVSPTGGDLEGAPTGGDLEGAPTGEGWGEALTGIDIPLNAGKKRKRLEDGNYREMADPVNYEMLKKNARQMRKEPTDAEEAFWTLVSGKELDVKFRRQHIIGNYIVDFVCLEKNLIVEIDGGYHDDEQQQIEDNLRSKDLKDYGFTILRLQNEEVIADPQEVIRKVKLALWLAEKAPLREGFGEACHTLVYCGPLDEFFGYSLGKLDWRTVTFKTRVEMTPNYQGNAVVNYTSHDVPYTRVIEHKHFEMFGQEVYDCPFTVISEEYSTEYREGMEPYYPVNDERNNALADAYRNLAAKENGVIFGGRLAEYKYYDMAPIIEKVLGMEI